MTEFFTGLVLIYIGYRVIKHYAGIGGRTPTPQPTPTTPPVDYEKRYIEAEKHFLSQITHLQTMVEEWQKKTKEQEQIYQQNRELEMGIVTDSFLKVEVARAVVTRVLRNTGAPEEEIQQVLKELDGD